MFSGVTWGVVSDHFDENLQGMLSSSYNSICNKKMTAMMIIMTTVAGISLRSL
jgi:Mg2+ and Co2+ transporter CorA